MEILCFQRGLMFSLVFVFFSFPSFSGSAPPVAGGPSANTATLISPFNHQGARAPQSRLRLPLPLVCLSSLSSVGPVSLPRPPEGRSNLVI